MSIQSYIHADVPGTAGAPLFFTFHGTGGDENQFTKLAAELIPGAHVISPRGDVSEFGAARFFKRTGEGVYDMDDLALRTERMAEFVSAQISRLGARRVIGLGYSNGANILASVLFRHAGLFDQAVLLHPLIPFRPPANPALSGKPVLITAGRADPICPAPLTLALEEYLREQGSKVHVEWHSGGHDIRSGEIAAIRTFLNA